MMAVVISMLRGVNVGSHNRIKMEALRALYESLGFEDVQSYVQSGNVVFRTQDKELPLLARRLESGIERKFGFSVSVIVRTYQELRSTVARNPFASRSGIDPSKLLVTFLAGEPTADARDKALQIKADPEEFHIDGREIFIYFPNGIARAKLSWTAIEKKLKTPATARNWNSVSTLLEMAERLEACGI
jgi:uncharacterized protein (DUF1697 family)